MLAARVSGNASLPRLLEKVEALRGCKVSEMTVWMYYVAALWLCLITQTKLLHLIL